MNIPSSEELRKRLARLGHAQMRELATRSGVPFTTLWKIRNGQTDNPRIETVRRIWPELWSAPSTKAKRV